MHQDRSDIVHIVYLYPLGRAQACSQKLATVILIWSSRSKQVQIGCMQQDRSDIPHIVYIYRIVGGARNRGQRAAASIVPAVACASASV